MAYNYELQESFFKDWTGDLYMTKDGELGLGYLETFPNRKEAIMRELGVTNEEGIWTALCNPEFSVSMFEIISWFNSKYNKIRQEAKNIPPIRLKVLNPMTQEVETITFRYYEFIDEDTYTVYFIEDPITTSNFFYRILAIGENKGCREHLQGDCYAKLETKINQSALYSDNVDIDKKILRQILDLSKKYQNYLNAYTFFANNPYLWPKLEWPLCQRGGLQSSIIGESPFNSLRKFSFAVGHMANERFFCDTYELGNPTLSFPSHFHTDAIYRERTALGDETHVFAKTLRLSKKRLPFKMD